MIAHNQPNLKNRPAPQTPPNVKGNKFITFTLLAVIALSAALLLSNRRRHAYSPHPSGSSPAMRERLKGGMNGEIPRADIQTIRIEPAPRYVANMATTTGDYVVSVRQAVGNTGAQNLLTGDSARLKQLILSLQAVALTPAAEKSFQDFGATLTATDDAGKRLDTVQTRASVRFERGAARLFLLDAPSPQSRRLLSVGGELVLKSKDGREKRLPFRLKNVSLPLSPHYYGVVSLGYLSEADSKQFAPPQNPADFPFINSPDATLFKEAFPPYAPEPAPIRLPARVTLSPYFPNEFPLYLPADIPGGATRFLNCALRIQSERAGAIEGAVSLSPPGGVAKESRFRVWDGEAGLFWLPEFAPRAGKRLALRLLLYAHAYQERAGSSSYIPPAPFPMQPGQRGAMLYGRMLVGNAPIPGAMARIVATPHDPSLKPQKINLPVNENGEWRIGNLAPGVYDFYMDAIDIRRSQLYSQIPPLEYLRYRYGFHQLKIENRLQRDVEARPGGLIALKPLRLMEGGNRADEPPSAQPASNALQPLSLSKFNVLKRDPKVIPAR